MHDLIDIQECQGGDEIMQNFTAAVRKETAYG